MPRAPRYVLRPQDKNVMRFSLETTHGNAHAEQTILLNLSETGLAFVTDSRKKFDLGDLIKVEIPIPSGEQLAWWAKVVRVQEYEPRSWFARRDSSYDGSRTLVGLRFEQLPEGHSRAIRKGIEKSFLQAVRDQRHRTWMYYRVMFSQYFLQFFIYAFLTAVALGLIYLWSKPDANYDPKRGSPWGQRFKF